MDLISTTYAEVKPERFQWQWPKRPDDEVHRSRQLRELLSAVPARLHHTEAGPVGKTLKELRLLAETQGARIRDAGIPRHVLEACTHPDTGKPNRAQLHGWDERDAALRFWRRAYCA